MDKKFNPQKLDKLNNPERLKTIPPDVIIRKLNIIDCQNIVDIGAGTGLFSRAFSKLFKNSIVYALDVSFIQLHIISDTSRA